MLAPTLASLQPCRFSKSKRTTSNPFIGGSIRVPAAFNAVYGIRPSHGRLPYAKLANSMEGQETIHSVCGPLAHSVGDLRLFMTSVLEQQPWNFDSKVVPMPWRQAEEESIRVKISSGGLTVGFYSCDGNVRPIFANSSHVINTMITLLGYATSPYSKGSTNSRRQTQRRRPHYPLLGTVQASLRSRSSQSSLRIRWRYRKYNTLSVSD